MDKVLCPWCGGLMTLNVNAYSDGTVTGAWYECLVCKAESPYIEDDAADDIKAAALSAALRRYVEPNRVLTLEELDKWDGVVYLEKAQRGLLDNVWLMDAWKENSNLRVFNGRRDGFMLLVADDYGSYWRAWPHRPTDEERQSVAWEESQ